MKTAREALMEHFEKVEHEARIEKRANVLIVGQELFARPVREGYDVTGIHRFESRQMKMKSPPAQIAGAGPRDRWGELR